MKKDNMIRKAAGYEVWELEIDATVVLQTF